MCIRDSTLWRTGPDVTGTHPTGDHRIELAIEGDVVGVHGRGEAVVAVTSGGVVFESPHGHEVRTVANFPMSVHASAASDDRRHLALEASDGSLHVLDLDTPAALVPLGVAEHSAVGPFAWSADGSTVAKLACPFDSSTCHLAVHPTNGDPPREMGTTDGEPSTLLLSQSGDRVAIAYQSHVSSWDTATGVRTRLRAPNRRRILAAAFHSSGALRIASMEPGSGASALYVGQVGDDGTVHTLFEEGGLRRLLVTEDGAGLVLETSGGPALLWRLAEDHFVPLREEALRGPDTPDIHLAPDGRQLWVAQPTAAEVVLLDLETGQRRTVPRPAGPVAWADGGGWVDVVRLRTLRRWGSAAPRTAEAFTDWLQTRTRVQLPLKALQSKMSDTHERL